MCEVYELSCIYVSCLVVMDVPFLYGSTHMQRDT